MNPINPILAAFFAGIATAGSLLVALFFLRFWQRSRDKLFLCFCFAFLLLACNSIAPLMLGTLNDQQPAVYLFRLAAFALIIWAILRKNMEKSDRV